MVLVARAMTPDGPVAVADLYIRRALWLLLFGFVDIFPLAWPGDILHIYAPAALVANIWPRYFINGPMEWAWRSLAYWQRQPFRRPPA